MREIAGSVRRRKGRMRGKWRTILSFSASCRSELIHPPSRFINLNDWR